MHHAKAIEASFALPDQDSGEEIGEVVLDGFLDALCQKPEDVSQDRCA